MNAAICLHWTAKQTWQPEKHIEGIKFILRVFLFRGDFNLPLQWLVNTTEAFIQGIHKNPELPDKCQV